MVILGGLEIVAAGYLIHKHNKNKRERQRLEEEAAALEEEQYHILPPAAPPTSSHHGRRHSHDGKHSHGRRHSHDRKDSKHRKDSRPPQYMPPPYTSASASTPNLAYSGPQHQAPPPPPPAQYQQPHLQPQAYYPPTGIPAHWEQAKTTGQRQASPQPMKYGFSDGQEHRSSLDVPARGRSERRGSPVYGNGNERSRESRVRFAEEDVVLGEDRRSPPPSYRV